MVLGTFDMNIIHINRTIAAQTGVYLHLCDNEGLKITQIHIHPHLCKYRGTYKLITCTVKTGSSRSGPEEGGKCESIGLSAACPSKVATIRSVVVAVA